MYPGDSTKNHDGDYDDLPRPLRLASDYFTQAMAIRQKLVAIGYSFRDEGIVRHLDRAAAYAGRSIHVHVIAPDKTADIDRLFERESVRGEFIEARFEEPESWTGRLKQLVETQE